MKPGMIWLKARGFMDAKRLGWRIISLPASAKICATWKLHLVSTGVHERYRGLYRKLSRRFPFAIYYLLTEDVVDVVAILDCRIDPNTTDARLGQTSVNRAADRRQTLDSRDQSPPVR
jgi:hypothetical protein